MSEPPDGSDHYSERLIKLSRLVTCYYRPDVPKKEFHREDYDLPEDVRLYLYPQSLFKFHPRFDSVIGNLLRRDPGGRLVLVEDYKKGYWKNLLMERFERAIPDVADRIIFVPRSDQEKFRGLLILADAILDNPYFSGMITALEAFAMTAPIVAWPGDLCSGRYVTACYKQMGLSELIATDEASFLSLVLRLAQDPDFKRRVRGDIQANSDKLYETIEPVREMETVFRAAYEAWRTGNTFVN